MMSIFCGDLFWAISHVDGKEGALLSSYSVWRFYVLFATDSVTVRLARTRSNSILGPVHFFWLEGYLFRFSTKRFKHFSHLQNEHAHARWGVINAHALAYHHKLFRAILILEVLLHCGRIVLILHHALPQTNKMKKISFLAVLILHA